MLGERFQDFSVVQEPVHKWTSVQEGGTDAEDGMMMDPTGILLLENSNGVPSPPRNGGSRHSIRERPNKSRGHCCLSLLFFLITALASNAQPEHQALPARDCSVSFFFFFFYFVCLC